MLLLNNLDLIGKKMDWFLYDSGLRLERVRIHYIYIYIYIYIYKTFFLMVSINLALLKRQLNKKIKEM